MDHGRAVTLEDVAREAGVAVSTVSRALSRPERVSARTREHVQAVARRLDYRPNLLARGLPSGRTGMLALVVTDITNPHQFGLIRGAETQAAAAGYTLVLADSRGRPDLEAELAARLGSSVDGFVLASSRRPDDELVELRRRRPLALYNRELEGFPSVVDDQDESSRQIVEHLVALGHRALAYLGGPRNAWTANKRWEALAAAFPRGGRGDRPARPVPADPRGRRRGRRRRAGLRRHRAGGVQRPDGDRRAAQAGAAGCRRSRGGLGGGPRRHLRRRLLPSAAHHRRQPRGGGRARAGRPPARQPRGPTHRPAHRAAGARVDRAAGCRPRARLRTRVTTSHLVGGVRSRATRARSVSSPAR